MKKIEIGLICLFLIACILYIKHWPMAGPLRTVAAMTLAQFYLVLSFSLFNDLGFRKMFNSTNYKSVKAIHIIIAVAAGMSLSISMLSILFLSMRWPGNLYMSFVSSIILIVISIVSLILYVVNKEKVYKNILSRTFTTLCLVIILWSVTKMYYEMDIEQFKTEIEASR